MRVKEFVVEKLNGESKAQTGSLRCHTYGLYGTRAPAVLEVGHTHRQQKLGLHGHSRGAWSYSRTQPSLSTSPLTTGASPRSMAGSANT